MPQMKPLNWFFIMMFIIFNLFMLNSLLYSFYYLDLFKKSNKKLLKNHWTWKW